MSFHVGAAFIWSRVSAPVPHRHVVVFGPDEFDGVITVTISSLKTLPSGKLALHDRTCLLNPGDHPFIVQPSFVRYDLTTFRDLGRLYDDCMSGRIELHQDVSADLLERLIDGIVRSGRAPQDIETYFI